MSNPSFRSPLYSELDDDLFSFPPNDPINYTPNPQLVNEEINPDSLPTTSLPMSDYHDLSLFLDDHHQDEDFDALIGHQFPTTSDWVAQLEQVGLDPVLHQGADYHQGSSDGIRYRSIDHDDQAGDANASGGGGVGDGSSIKKLAHNAKERVRRLKLNDTYVALRSLLPESKRAKEKWSAPYMIDRALEYTPKLQAEVEKLTLEKSNMLSMLAKKQVLTTDDAHQANATDKDDKQKITVSITEVKRGELIIQFCQQIKDRVDNNNFSTLIENLQGQGMQVVGASSIRACEDRSCFHLHLQMGDTPFEANYVADLRKKLIYWLSQ